MEIYHDATNSCSIEMVYSIEGYNTYKVAVGVGVFKGEASFCMAESFVQQSKERIIEVLSNNRGIIELFDYDSESHIAFVLGERQLTVRGGFEDPDKKNSLRFEFCADQTVLQLLQEALETTI